MERLPSNETGAVMLVYHKTTKDETKEELEVFYATRCSVSSVTDLPVPVLKCSAGVYLGNVGTSLEPCKSSSPSLTRSSILDAHMAGIQTFFHGMETAQKI